MILSVLSENDLEVLREEDRGLAVMRISSRSLAEEEKAALRVSNLISAIFFEGVNDKREELLPMRKLLVPQKQNRKNHRLML